MQALLKFIITAALGLAAFGACAQDKVVYHFDSGIAQATKGLRNIRNHLDVEPKAQIIEVVKQPLPLQIGQPPSDRRHAHHETRSRW